jgi:hypothetical protein
MAKSSTYVIGCKLPSGLSFVHNGVKITLSGANSSVLVNGFGLTKNVPADAWESFVSIHKDSKFIRNGVIFAVSDEESAQDASLEREGVKTGLEQASPKSAGVEPDKEE